MVGVVCSPQAEEICQKNNLTFVELLQPFSKLSADGMQNKIPLNEMFNRSLDLIVECEFLFFLFSPPIHTL